MIYVKVYRRPPLVTILYFYINSIPKQDEDLHLPHHSILQRRHTAQSRLRPQLRNPALLVRALARQLRHNPDIEANLERLRRRKPGLNALPDLLLRVQHGLWLALPALKVHSIAGLAVCRGVDEFNRALVCVLAFDNFGRRSEHHGAGLDAAHGDGLEIAYGDDFAVLHVGEGDQAVEAGADGAHDLAFVLGGVVCAGGIAAGNGADEEGVGVGVGLGFEDVADAEVDEGWGEGLLNWCAGSWLAGKLLEVVEERLTLFEAWAASPSSPSSW